MHSRDVEHIENYQCQTAGDWECWMVWMYVGRAKGTLENTILHSKVDGKTSRGRPAKQWFDDVKEWTVLSSNDIWKEPEDHVAWRKLTSHITPVY